MHIKNIKERFIANFSPAQPAGPAHLWTCGIVAIRRFFPARVTIAPALHWYLQEHNHYRNRG